MLVCLVQSTMQCQVLHPKEAHLKEGDAMGIYLMETEAFIDHLHIVDEDCNEK